MCQLSSRLRYNIIWKTYISSMYDTHMIFRRSIKKMQATATGSVAILLEAYMSFLRSVLVGWHDYVNSEHKNRCESDVVPIAMFLATGKIVLYLLYMRGCVWLPKICSSIGGGVYLWLSKRRNGEEWLLQYLLSLTLFNSLMPSDTYRHQ